MISGGDAVILTGEEAEAIVAHVRVLRRRVTAARPGGASLVQAAQAEEDAAWAVPAFTALAGEVDARAKYRALAQEIKATGERQLGDVTALVEDIKSDRAGGGGRAGGA